jgi:hypothetical protein
MRLHIDENGFYEDSGNYTSHVIIANGNIGVNFQVTSKTNVKVSRANKNLADLYFLSKYEANVSSGMPRFKQI